MNFDKHYSTYEKNSLAQKQVAEHLLSYMKDADILKRDINSIFEMRYDLPIFISQPYIYIANNYDNLDTLIKELPKHSFGLKGLFPLWALTGIKFIYPKMVDFPIFVNKTELTTVTLFYDAFVGMPLYKPEGYKTNHITAGFQAGFRF